MKYLVGFSLVVMSLPVCAQDLPAKKDGPYLIQNCTGMISRETAKMTRKVPSPDIDGPTSYRLTRKKINELPYVNINDMVSLSPAVYQRRRGDGVQVQGDRMGGNLYIVDGMRMMR